MSKKSSIVFLIGLAIIGACVVVSGCTSAQNDQGAVQNNQTVPATPYEAASTTAPATTLVTSAPVTSQTTVMSTTATPAPAVVSVTLNSAEKQAKLGSFTQKVSGRTFLVLDLTIKNNDTNEDFEYTNASFALVDKTASPPHTLSPLTTIVTGSLENPFTTGMVPVKSEKTGQIVFSVNENSGLYKFTLYDAKGKEITSIDNITVA